MALAGTDRVREARRVQQPDVRIESDATACPAGMRKLPTAFWPCRPVADRTLLAGDGSKPDAMPCYGKRRPAAAVVANGAGMASLAQQAMRGVQPGGAKQ